MPTPKIDASLRQEALAIAEQEGCELYDIELHNRVLRVTLDRPDGAGVTIDDCATVSRQLSAYLDVLDFSKDRYTLEVSSPGLDRKLRGAQDFDRFQGSLVRVTYRDSQKDGAKRTVIGRLLEAPTLDNAPADVPSPAADGTRTITVLEAPEAPKAAEIRHDIPLAEIQAARLEPEL